MGLIQWRTVRWRGGDGYSGFVDGDMTCMIFPATPDRDLPPDYCMFILDERYETEARRPVRHGAIPLDSLEEGQRRAEVILAECLAKAGTE